MENKTTVQEFILLGFSMLEEYEPFLFPLFCLSYIVTVGGNVCIIITYILSPSLQTPMYFFLANFSLLEIMYVTAIIPNTLSNLLSCHKVISLYGCGIQMYCFLLLGGTEFYMLAAMAYDRYNAICQPLLYAVIMNRVACHKHIIGSWFIGGINSLVHTALAMSLPFCRSNEIDHFYCDVPPLLKLSCKNTWLNELTIFSFGSSLIIGSFILTVFSYTQIISTVLQRHSSSGRKKAFSTCTSHLTVAAIFYGSVIFMYFRPKSGYGSQQDTVVSLMYTVIAPLLNPFIYTLRNKEVKSRMKKIFCIKPNFNCPTTKKKKILHSEI